MSSIDSCTPTPESDPHLSRPVSLAPEFEASDDAWASTEGTDGDGDGDGNGIGVEEVQMQPMAKATNKILEQNLISSKEQCTGSDSAASTSASGSPFASTSTTNPTAEVELITIPLANREPAADQQQQQLPATDNAEFKVEEKEEGRRGSTTAATDSTLRVRTQGFTHGSDANSYETPSSSAAPLQLILSPASDDSSHQSLMQPGAMTSSHQLLSQQQPSQTAQTHLQPLTPSQLQTPQPQPTASPHLSGSSSSSLTPCSSSSSLFSPTSPSFSSTRLEVQLLHASNLFLDTTKSYQPFCLLHLYSSQQSLTNSIGAKRKATALTEDQFSATHKLAAGNTMIVWKKDKVFTEWKKKEEKKTGKGKGKQDKMAVLQATISQMHATAQAASLTNLSTGSEASDLAPVEMFQFLGIEVWNSRFLRADEFVGHCQLSVEEILTQQGKAFNVPFQLVEKEMNLLADSCIRVRIVYEMTDKVRRRREEEYTHPSQPLLLSPQLTSPASDLYGATIAPSPSGIDPQSELSLTGSPQSGAGIVVAPAAAVVVEHKEQVAVVEQKEEAAVVERREEEVELTSVVNLPSGPALATVVEAATDPSSSPTPHDSQPQSKPRSNFQVEPLSLPPRSSPSSSPSPSPSVTSSISPFVPLILRPPEPIPLPARTSSHSTPADSRGGSRGPSPGHSRASSRGGTGNGLYITIHEGRNLAAKDANGLSDPYLIVTLYQHIYLSGFSSSSPGQPNFLRKRLAERVTSVKAATLHPIWNEEFFFHEYGAVAKWDSVGFEMYDKDDVREKITKWKRDDYMGNAFISYEEIRKKYREKEKESVEFTSVLSEEEAERLSFTLPLLPDPSKTDIKPGGKDYVSGEIVVSVKYDDRKRNEVKKRIEMEMKRQMEVEELKKSNNKLEIEIKKGEDLASKDKNGLSDPYVLLQLHDTASHELLKEAYRTNTIYKSLNPVWENAVYSCSIDVVQRFYTLTFEVWDSDPLPPNDFMGSATIRYEEIVERYKQREKEVEEEKVKFTEVLKEPEALEFVLELQPRKGRANEGKDKVSGRITVMIQYYSPSKDTWMEAYLAEKKEAEEAAARAAAEAEALEAERRRNNQLWIQVQNVNNFSTKRKTTANEVMRYCNVQLNSKSGSKLTNGSFRTSPISSQLPEIKWSDEFSASVSHVQSFRSILFELYEGETVVGQATLSYEQIRFVFKQREAEKMKTTAILQAGSETQPVAFELKLHPKKKQSMDASQLPILTVNILYYSPETDAAFNEEEAKQTRSRFVLDVHIISGHQLAPKDKDNLSDPYVAVHLNPTENEINSKPSSLHQTKIIRKTLNPEWDQHLTNFSKEELMMFQSIGFVVWDYDNAVEKATQGKLTDDFMGYTIVTLEQIREKQRQRRQEVKMKVKQEQDALLRLRAAQDAAFRSRYKLSAPQPDSSPLSSSLLDSSPDVAVSEEELEGEWEAVEFEELELKQKEGVKNEGKDYVSGKLKVAVSYYVPEAAEKRKKAEAAALAAQSRRPGLVHVCGYLSLQELGVGVARVNQYWNSVALPVIVLLQYRERVAAYAEKQRREKEMREELKRKEEEREKMVLDNRSRLDQLIRERRQEESKLFVERLKTRNRVRQGTGEEEEEDLC